MDPAVYRALVEGAREAMAVVDPKTGRLIYANPRFLAVALGNTGPGDLLGAVHPGDRAALHRLLTGADGAGTVRLPRPDGGWRAVWLVGEALEGAERPLVLRAAGGWEGHPAQDPGRDWLTGLASRSALEERIERCLQRLHHSPGYAFAVLMLDIDDFKLVNESLGRASGDGLLTAVGRRLARTLRPGDLIARLGGDEFVVVVDRVRDDLGARLVLDRLQRELRTPLSVAGQDVFATASAGIVVARMDHESPTALLHEAEAAMHRAKRQGRGSAEVYRQDMQASSLARLRLDTDLRRAIERQEFRVHYQPIVDLQDGRTAGFEALVRWQHPERGLLAPSEFIGLAEHTGLIVPICTWVLTEACRQLQAWRHAWPARVRLGMSMNFTATHFQHEEVTATVRAALESAGMAPAQLTAEITESVMMQDVETVIAVLRRLVAMGVSVHLDDFGTGYSSLSYLHRLPAQAIKIDRSFVREVGNDPQAKLLVGSIVDLAHTLGRTVIAEGIETEDQLAVLQAMGCDQGQGFHFSRPLPAEEIGARLRATA
jgi:diguanylate cyclase (GGDEF)-like protein